MLKRIPPVLSPELLKILCEMGHGDTIVLADANFPSENIGNNRRVLRYDGLSIPGLLEAVLTMLPLDTHVSQPVTLMQAGEEYEGKVSIQAEYADIIRKTEGFEPAAIRLVERFAFYREAAGAYAIVATGEQAQYANIMLQKGVVKCC